MSIPPAQTSSPPF